MSFDFNIRESHRVKGVKIKVSQQDGLVVVTPPGYAPQKITPLLEKKRDWIERALSKTGYVDRRDEPLLPTHIHLHALGHSWDVCYEKTAAPQAKVIEKKADTPTLLVYGPVDDETACTDALKTWLKKTAKMHFKTWLAAKADELCFDYGTLTVRDTKSRWGSCTAKGDINLNAKLVFLAPDLVDYVMTHELCHTMHLNHSASFWALVNHHCPTYKHAEEKLKNVWNDLPRWAL